ncbi:MAG: N-acetylmuramoyl-L-alanine amidase [Candidatus Omnitrophica bacterium]|nr:N-acetylmuramoyl-L-alanine amidase [Candidatus Omnitrophota bacterium]
MKISNKNYILIMGLGLILSFSGCATHAPYLRLDSVLQNDIRTFDGIQYVPLIRLCEAYGLDWKWDTFIKTAAIERKGKRIILRDGSDRILVNGDEKRLDRPVLTNGGIVFVPISFIRNNLGAIVETPSFKKLPEAGISKKFGIKTIVIDPGHGGKDPGAIGRRFRQKEKYKTLAISKRLKDMLEDKGLKIVMTRDDDTFVSLPRRVEIANRNGADLFVSIHINASRSRSLSGFECYYLSDATDDNARAIEAFENASLKMDEENILKHSKGRDKTLWDMTLSENRVESAGLAKHICGSVEDSAVLRTRGVKSARFYVLKGTRMPAVLVEVAYLSNRYEEMKLKDKDFLEDITGAIAKGILAYKNEYEKTEGYTNI